MKLVAAHVEKFRNFDDSGEVAIEPGVTVLIGKNESGKTAFLQALQRLNPLAGGRFEELDHYPRWLYTKDRKTEDIKTKSPVSGTFELEPADVAALAAKFGGDVVRTTTVTFRRCYDGSMLVQQAVPPDERLAVAEVLSRADLPRHLEADLANSDSFAALDALLEELASGTSGDPTKFEVRACIARVRSNMMQLFGDQGFQQGIDCALLSRLPKFFYFSDYDFICGRTDLKRIFTVEESELLPSERTSISLLRLAGADNEAILEEDYESRKAELEAVSNDLTAEMSRYWSQSNDLEVVIDIDKETTPLSYGQCAVARYLEIRVKDRRHGHTDNIDKRSNGFRWFFSFLAAFSEYESLDERVIILLDEPALTLHPRAQEDFVRFIHDRLAPKQQVIYSTHSPFMVAIDNLDGARFVEDKGRGIGSRISDCISENDPDTIFPLQAQAAYEIARSSPVKGRHLLVTTLADYTYLLTLSNFLETQGRRGLDPRFSMVPLGDLQNVELFLALFGKGHEATVLVTDGEAAQTLAAVTENGRLLDRGLVLASALRSGAQTAIEDFISVEDFVHLYNASAEGLPVLAGELAGSETVIAGVESIRGEFDRDRPAEWLLAHREDLLPKLSTQTVENFEKLFELVNATLDG